MRVPAAVATPRQCRVYLDDNECAVIKVATKRRLVRFPSTLIIECRPRLCVLIPLPLAAPNVQHARSALSRCPSPSTCRWASCLRSRAAPASVWRLLRAATPRASSSRATHCGFEKFPPPPFSNPVLCASFAFCPVAHIIMQ